MRTFLTSTALAFSLAFPAFADEAGMAHAGDIVIHDGWARASLGSIPNSAAYMTLENHGDAADKLIKAASPAAKMVELHTHIMENDIARMRPVEAMADYVGLFSPDLVGLTGTTGETNAAAKAYRVYHSKVKDEATSADYLVDHSAFFYLMGPDGNYVDHFSHNATPEEMTAGIEDALG